MLLVHQALVPFESQISSISPICYWSLTVVTFEESGKQQGNFKCRKLQIGDITKRLSDVRRNSCCNTRNGANLRPREVKPRGKLQVAAEDDATKAEKEQPCLLQLRKGVEEGDMAIVSEALLAGADVNIYSEIGVTPLCSVILDRHYEMVELLLAYGADLNKADLWNSHTALYDASSNGHPEVVQLLHGADVNKADTAGRTPLDRASYGGHKEVVELLLKYGADANQTDRDGTIPLHHASEHGHMEIVRLLANHGADVNKACLDGLTALYWASFGGQKEVAALLLANGAYANAADRHGKTPLYVACSRGHTEVADVLLKNGADISKADKGGETPFYQACCNGHVELVELLLASGADVDEVQKCGGTPLHWASYNGHPEVVELLLRRGADVNRPGQNGVTALWRVRREIKWRPHSPEQAEVIRRLKTVEALLLQHGALSP